MDYPFSRNTLWVNTPTHIFGHVMHIHANTEYGQPAICGECLRCHSTITYRIQFQFQVYISRAVETCELWQVLGSWISVSEVKNHLREHIVMVARKCLFLVTTKDNSGRGQTRNMTVLVATRIAFLAVRRETVNSGRDLLLWSPPRSPQFWSPNTTSLVATRNV